MRTALPGWLAEQEHRLVAREEAARDREHTCEAHEASLDAQMRR
jgi:hypothetical protein